MKKKMLCFLCLIVLSIGLTAQQQTPFLQWQKSYGGSGDDLGESIQQTADNGYIIAGSTNSKNGDITENHGKSDYWILKLDVTGKIQWQRIFGGSRSESANSIHQTIDGGYIVAGSSSSNDGDVTGNHGNYDYWILKLDSHGNMQWERSYGGSSTDRAWDIKQTADGGFIVAGSSGSNNGDVTGNHGNYDYWVLKLDSNGNLQWQQTYGGSDFDFARSVQQTTDGGYVVLGTSSSNDGDVAANHGSDDYWLIKLNSNGNLQWQHTYGGSDYDFASGVQQTTDGGYVVAGSSYSKDKQVTGNHGRDDYWILKVDATGNLQWQTSYGGKGYEGALEVHQAGDGGYVISGSATSNNGDVLFNRGSNDFCTIKLDAAGALKWQKILGGTNYDAAHSIHQCKDDGFIITGTTLSDDENVNNNHGKYDVWIVKLSPETLDNNVRINPYHTAVNCSFTNSILCDIANTATTYMVRLYRFGVLYDSALNVTDRVVFHNLPCGSYYVTAADANGIISYSEERDIVPPPYNISTTNITSTSAHLNWTGFDCVNTYAIQFHLQDATEWKDKKTTGNGNSFSLDNLLPSTTYVWRVASEKRVNGIKASGKFSDSLTFTTAAAIVADNRKQTGNLKAINSSAHLTMLPDLAKKNYCAFFIRIN